MEGGQFPAVLAKSTVESYNSQTYLLPVSDNTESVVISPTLEVCEKATTLNIKQTLNKICLRNLYKSYLIGLDYGADWIKFKPP